MYVLTFFGNVGNGIESDTGVQITLSNSNVPTAGNVLPNPPAVPSADNVVSIDVAAHPSSPLNARMVFQVTSAPNSYLSVISGTDGGIEFDQMISNDLLIGLMVEFLSL